MINVQKRCVAVFKSKSQVMSFIESMKLSGVVCKMISTPKEAKAGCGVSAEFPLCKLNLARTILQSGGFSSFYGFFLLEIRGTHTTTVRM